MSELLSGQLLFAALLTGSLYALVALGLNLVYGTLRLLNVAHGDLVMIGAYVAFWAMTLAGIPPYVALVLAAVLCAGLGWLIYVALFRRLLDNAELSKRLEGNSLLVFFGLSVILQNVAALLFTSTPRGYQYMTQVYHFAGIAATGNRLFTLGVAAALCLAAALVLRFNIFGLGVRALIERREAAFIIGLDVERVQTISLCAGFAIAGVAGVLVSMSQAINPFMGFPFTISAFVVIILGGLGNIVAGILAGLLLGVLQTYGVALTSSDYNSVLIYGVFVAALVIRPQGLFGRARVSR